MSSFFTYFKQLPALKKWIWAYFVLIIFEGALRKWILPGLSGPLLLVRDPIAIGLLVVAWNQGVWKPNGYVTGVWIASILAFILTLGVGHGNMIVALYGLRITLFHFPLIFLIGQLFNRTDVLQVGKILLWICIGMTVLVALQFFSPQSAWVNRGIGGDVEGSGFSGAAGYYRVPGTFSFTNGLSMFYAMTAAYILYFWLTAASTPVKKWLLLISTGCLMAAIPLSISRSVMFSVSLSVAFILPIVGNQPRIVGRLLVAGILIVISLLILSNFAFFQTATFAFTERFANAGESEGGVEGTLINRFLGGMVEAVTQNKAPFWGLGLGMGTNAGAQLLSGGRTFLVAEGEWGRLIGEMGFLLGLWVIIIRCALVINLFKKSWQQVRMGNILPWMLMSFGALPVLQGQWAQPTALGFAVVGGGLVMAAMRRPVKKVKHHPESKATADP